MFKHVTIEGKEVMLRSEHDRPGLERRFARCTLQTVRTLLRTSPNKKKCKKFTEEYGIPPAHAAAKINGCLISIWKVEDKRLWRHVFGSGKTIISDRVKCLHDRLDEFTQTVEDGNGKLIPLMMALDESIPQLRARYGKNLWKRICQQSAGRISMIAAGMYARPDAKECVAAQVQAPTTLLNKVPGDMVLEAVSAYADSGLPYKEIADHARGRLRWTMMDVWRMEELLGLPRSSGKTPGGWGRRHDDLVRRMNKTKVDNASDEKFIDPRVEVIDGFTFTRLCSERDYLREGAEMQHCIGSYVDLAFGGAYIAFKVEGNGERATFGLGVRTDSYGGDRKTIVYFDQLYGSRNSRVTSRMRDAADDLGAMLTEEVNKARSLARLAQSGCAAADF